MRILHTADWHIGKRLDRFSRLDEQRAVLSEIAAIADAEDVDLAIVAGDLYDVVNPGSDAEELLYEGLVQLSGDGKRPVVAIAGNHDSPDRVLAADVLAKEHGIILVGYPRETVSVPRTIGRSTPTDDVGPGYTLTPLEPGIFEIRLDSAPGTPIRIVATPYANETRLRKALIPDDRSELDGANTIEASVEREALSEAGSFSETGASPEAGSSLDTDPIPAIGAADHGTKDKALLDLLTQHWSKLAVRYALDGTVNLLVTHLFFAGDPSKPPVEPDGERSIAHVGAAPPIPPHAVPSAYQYVACGHLHRPHTLGTEPPIRYAGSPLAYSFAETDQQKSVTIVDLEPQGELGAEPGIRTVPLSMGYPLLRYTAADVDDAIAWLEAHYDAYVELHLHVSFYLSGTDRNRLNRAHPRIVTIVPLVGETDSSAIGEPIDPTGALEELFIRYATDSLGSTPSEELLGLFREVVAGGDGVPEGSQ